MIALLAKEKIEDLLLKLAEKVGVTVECLIFNRVEQRLMDTV